MNEKNPLNKKNGNGMMIKDYELLESELLRLKNQILSMLDCFVGETANDLRYQIHECDDAEVLVTLSINALSYITGRCGIEQNGVAE